MSTQFRNVQLGYSVTYEPLKLRFAKYHPYIQDCIDAVLVGIQKSQHKINIYNMGQNNYITINQSVDWITDYLGLKPKLTYSGGQKGWIGDNPFIFLDTHKIRSLGWNPRVSIQGSIIKTVKWLERSRHILYGRD